MPGWQMNPQRMNFMDQNKDDSGKHVTSGEKEEATGHSSHKPHIHVHSHSQGHTVHIMHHDGTHEKHEHPHGDAEGIAQHVHTHLGESEESPEMEHEEQQAGKDIY
jgi:hypothetical protein